MKTATGLFALAFLLSACVSGVEIEGATTTEATSTADAESNDSSADGAAAEGAGAAADGSDSGDDDAASEDGDDGEAMNDDDAAGVGAASGDDSAGSDSAGSNGADGSAGGDASAGGGSDSELADDSALGFILATIGAEPTDEILSCIEDEGADPQTGFAADEAEATKISLASIRCLSDELSAFGARTYPPTPGVETEDVECVLQVAYGYIGELPQAEAEAAISATDLPPEIEAEILARATAGCGVTEEVAADILDFLAS